MVQIIQKILEVMTDKSLDRQMECLFLWQQAREVPQWIQGVILGSFSRALAEKEGAVRPLAELVPDV